jgi:hypothetical protein
VAGTEADEPLARTPVPLEREAQRLPLGLELEREAVIGGQAHGQPRLAAAAEGKRELEPVVAGREHCGALGALGGLETLARDDALGEADEAILDLAGGDPHLAGAQQPPSGALERERKRPQG